MRVLFYEPNPAGHHFAYLGRMLPGFLRLPVTSALATTPEAADSETFAAQIAPHTDRLEILPLCRPLLRRKSLRNAWRRLEDLRRALESWRPDHACVVYADGMWQLMALWPEAGLGSAARGVTLEGWVYRGGFSYPDATSPPQAAIRALFRRLLRRGVFAKLHLQDELLFEFARGVEGSQTEVVLAADPIKLREPTPVGEARAAFGLPAEGRVIVCSGTVSRRKGVDLAMRAFARLQDDPSGEPVRLLVAGPHDDEIRGLLARAPYAGLVAQGRIVSFDRFLDEDQMLLSAEAGDLLLAPYPNHSGRSSIILWGAAAGVPVLGASRGCIGHVIRAEGLGATCDVTDIGSFAEAIRASLASPLSKQEAARVRAYAAWHGIENYQAMSAELVERRTR